MRRCPFNETHHMASSGQGELSKVSQRISGWGGGGDIARRLSGGAAQDAALNERVGGLRRMLLCRDCHNVMPVSR